MNKKIVSVIVVAVLVLGALAFYVFDLKSYFVKPLSDEERVAAAKAEIQAMQDQSAKADEQKEQEDRTAELKQIVELCQLNVKPEEVTIQRLVDTVGESKEIIFETSTDERFYRYVIARVDNKIRWFESHLSEGGDMESEFQICFHPTGNLQYYFEQFSSFDSENQKSFSYSRQSEYDESGNLIPSKTKFKSKGDSQGMKPDDQPMFKNTAEIEAKLRK